MNTKVTWPVIDGWIPIGSVFTIEDDSSGTKFKVKRTWGHEHADVEPLTSNDMSIIRKIYPKPDNFWSAEFHKVKVHINDQIIPAAFMTFPHAGTDGGPSDVVSVKDLTGYTSDKDNTSDIYSEETNRIPNRNSIRDNDASGHMCLYFRGSKNHITGKPDPKVDSLFENQMKHFIAFEDFRLNKNPNL